MNAEEFRNRLAKLRFNARCQYCARSLVNGECKNPRCINYIKDDKEPERSYKERVTLLDSGLLTEEEIHLPKRTADKLIAKRKAEVEGET